MSTSELPHSRACGITPHPHGDMCHANCPTCHGQGPGEVRQEGYDIPLRWCGCPGDSFHGGDCPVLAELAKAQQLPGSGYVTAAQVAAAVDGLAWALESTLRGEEVPRG